tara:strand:- start:35 stop:388 length:354 start_codon:yes stop_codon:yes gene_type:complete
MMFEVVGTGDEAGVHALKRELRQFVGAWHLFLAGEVVEEHRWRCVPGWAKKVPGMLDEGWILFDLDKHVGDAWRIRFLRSVLDQVVGWSASGDMIEGVLPSIDTAVEMFEELFGVEE